MTAVTETGVSTQVYRVFIKATPEAIWEAITNPDWTEKYGYKYRSEYDLSSGGQYRYLAGAEGRARGMPDAVVDGEVLEVDPPRRLVQTWRFLMDADLKEEQSSRVTYEIAEDRPGLAKLTVTHELEGAPRTAALVDGDIEDTGGGWSFVLSDLKTLLETGTSLDG